MKKGHIVLLVILAVIVVLGISAYVTLFTSSTRGAFLRIESGDVQVDQGQGFRTAVDGMALKRSDKIKTGDIAEAIVVLHESVIIHLDPNTEVTLADLDKDNIKIEQDSGSTWNKFTGLSGVKGYEVQTPETVATVRGTEFGVDMTGIVVGEGEVDVSVGNTKYKLLQGKKIIKRDGLFIQEDLTEEERQRIVTRMGKTLRVMKNLREDEVRKKPLIYNQLKKFAKLDDQGVRDNLEKIDRGELDEDELIKHSPVPVKSLERSVEITKKIKQQYVAIEEVKAMQLTQNREQAQR